MGHGRWPLLWCLQAVLVGGTGPAQEKPPRAAGWSLASSPSWAPSPAPGPSGDPEGSAAAMAFLRTGDARRLARANCSRGVAAGAAGPGPPPAVRATLRAAPEALAHAANFLNMLFQTNDIREASVAEDVEWYQALVRSLAEGHPWVQRAVLALDAHPLAAKPRLMLQATKKDGEILLQDVSAAAPSLGNLSWDNEWFNALRAQRTTLLRKRVLSNDLRSMDTPKWQRGDSYVGEPGHVRWSPPFLECREGRFLPAWMVTLSSAFYGLKPDLSPEFKGVVRVDIELRDVAIDQCASGPGWFAGTHRCDLNSTQCVPQESRGFVLGRYLCQCKPGFYRASGVASGARAGVAGSTAGEDGGARLACQPCRQGCATCEADVPCLIQEDRVLRAAILSCQACCMLAVFLSMLISYHCRRSKRIRTSGVVLLEMILFGSLLLYFPVFILYFKPSIFRCIVLRWVRMLGFAIVYGTITLKLYRVLKVFLSRTAQRVSYVSSGRVLKMLGLILLLVLWFLAAWTIGMLENVEKNIPLVIRTQTARGLHFYICSHDHWDYMMVIAEMLFLLWGSFLCFATRAVPSAFHEPRYMGIALHNELMISAAFHVVRFIMVPSLHPDWTLLLFFAHTHGTITMTLALLFIPKFLHAGSPLREEIAAEVYEDELDTRHSGSCLTGSFASAWSEHSLDPDDIREELKKLYVQLEVHKTRRMAANNPHLPKKRSSRRSLGRSPASRGAEVPEVGQGVGTAASRRGSSAKRPLDGGSRPRAAASPESHEAPEPGREGTGTTASEPSDSESLDAAPLVCKSASAHNLAVPGQLLLPRAAPLQKSLSVVAGARAEALLAASRAAREEWHASQHPGPGHGAPREAGKPQSPPGTSAGSSPPGGSPQDVAPAGDGEGQRRVTYAPIKSISVDSSQLRGRVRVAVKRTPPPPPVRYQSLGHRATESPEPPPQPLAQAGETEGTPAVTAGDDPGGTPPATGKGSLLGTASVPAQVCPWELVQDEILSQKEKAAKAAELGATGDAAATSPPSLKPASEKISLWSLGLALKAFNRSRGKSILRGKRQGEGTSRKGTQEGDSQREKPSLAETSARPPKSPEATTCPWQGDTVPCQENNNAGTAWEAEGWGYSGAEGQWDIPTLGRGDDEKAAEEPSSARGDADAVGGLEPPPGMHKVPSNIGHRGGAEGPYETPAVGSDGRAETRPQEGAEAAVVQPGQDAPAATTELLAPRGGVAGPGEGLEGDKGSIRPWDRAEMEQPHAKPASGSPRTPTPSVGSVGARSPQGAPGVPAGRGALLRQAAVASQEDSRVPTGEESPAKELGKGGSQPELLSPGGSWGMKRVPPRSWSLEVAPAAVGKAGRVVGRQAEICSGETRVDSSIKREIRPWEDKRWGPGRALGTGGSEGDPHHPGEELGTEKPPTKSPELLEVAPEKADREGGRRAEVCPWETREGAKTFRAEICPWDTEGDQPEQERQDGERMQLAKSIRATSLGSLRAQQSRSSLQVPSQPWGSTSSEEPPPKPAPKSSELPKVTLRSTASARASICPWEAAEAESDAGAVCPWERGTAFPSAGKSDDGEIPQVKNGISLQRVAPTGTGEAALAADKGSSQQGSPHPGEGAEQPTVGLTAKHPALPKTSPKQGAALESKKANVCPWEVEDQLPAKTQICPWEEPAAPSGEERPSQDSHGTSKGENKPGPGGLEEIKAKLAEVGGHQPEHKDTKTFAKLIRRSLEISKAESKKSQNVESIKEEICPWESLGAEQTPEKTHTSNPAPPKFPSKKSQSEESLKAEICPWEAPDIESGGKAEICPWEAAAPPSGKDKSRQDKDGLSLVSKSPSTGQGVLKETADSTSGKEEKGNRDRESVCPWESLDTQGSSTGYSMTSTEKLKDTAKKSESTGNVKAEICPWEASDVEAGGKAEICPWEAAAPPSGKGKSRQDKDGLSLVSKSPSTGQGVLKETADSTSGKEEKGSRDRESVCPWESLDTEQTPQKPHSRSPALPKSPSKKSQSEESQKAEICPWEAPEVEAGGKAEICPWEGAAPPLDQQKAKQGLGGGWKGNKHITCQAALGSPERPPGKGSSERGAVCPWESLGTEETPEKPSTRSPELPKSPSKKSQSEESLKAEICPWEAPELKSTDKAEICPWEAAAPPSGKEKSRQDKDGLSKVSKSPSASHAVLKEIGDSSSGKEEKASRDRESVCPWESLDTQGCSTGYSMTSTEKLKGTAKKSESTGSMKAEICPWESLGTEQTPQKPSTKNPALPKSSKKSQSEESLKAEICPWEAPDIESGGKAEICPWEAAAPPSGKDKSRQDKDGLSLVSKSPSTGQGVLKETADSTSGKEEKKSTDRVSICPWESTDMEQPPEKPHARRPELPKSPSKKSQSEESQKAEICPWEAPEVEAGGKAEICPWEGAAPLPGRGAAQGKWSLPARGAGASKAPEKGSREVEAICPWESPGTEETSQKTAPGKEPSEKSDSVESRKPDICPWEAAEPSGVGKESLKTATHPQGAARSSPTGMGKSKAGAEASTGSPPAPLRRAKGRAAGEAGHKPLCRISPGIQPPGGSRAELLPRGVSRSPSTAEVCPWDTEEAPPVPDKSSREMKRTPEVCPWEMESVDAPQGSQQGRCRASPQDGGRGGSGTQPDVCPWDHE